jgi:hypothetical protein
MALARLSPGSLALPAIGFTAHKLYDRGIRNRAAAVSEAIRSQAPASMAQPGYVAPVPRVAIGPPLPTSTAYPPNVSATARPTRLSVKYFVVEPHRPGSEQKGSGIPRRRSDNSGSVIVPNPLRLPALLPDHSKGYPASDIAGQSIIWAIISKLR